MLRLSEPAGLDRIESPVTSGVPFPAGALRSASDVRILSPKGAAMPHQADVLATWPDGSVKWLLVDFQATVPASGVVEYRLEYGPGVRGTAEAAHPLRIADEPSRCTVRTGDFEVSLDRTAFNLLDAVSLSGERLVASNRSNGGWIVDDKGRAFLTGAGRPESFVVEEAGPLRAVIKVEGKHRSQDGKCVVNYVARLTFFAGKSYVKVSYTVVNKEPMARGEALRLNEMALRTCVGLEGERTFALGGESVVTGALTSGASVRLFQMASDKHEALRPSGERVSGRRAAGWAEVRSGNAGVVVAVRDFWQQFPKSIEVSEDGTVKVGLWPKDAGPLTKFFRARAKTHEVMYAFYKGGGETARRRAVADLNQPLVATTPSKWVVESKVFGNLPDYGVPLLESMMARNLAVLLKQREANNEYGMFNYGDWNFFMGGTAHKWGNLQYDTAYTLFVQFARSGDRSFFDAAEAAIKHAMDVDIEHFRPEMPNWEGANYAYGEGNPDHIFNPGLWHIYTEGFISHYVMTGDRRGLEVAQKIADWCCHIADNYADQGTHRGYLRKAEERETALPLMALAAVYSVRRDERYLRAMKKLVQHARDWQAQNGTWDVPVSSEGPASFMMGILMEALRKYYDVSGDESVVPMVTRASDALLSPTFWAPNEKDGDADGLIARPLLSRTAKYTGGISALTAPYLGDAYSWTNDPRYLKKAARLMMPALMDTAYIGKQVGQNGRSAARFFYWWEAYAKTLPTHPEVSLLCHLENAADIAFPTYGRGGAVMRGAFEPGKSGTGYLSRKTDESGRNYVFFPTEGNVAKKEGTVEFWLKPLNDLAAYRYRRVISSGSYNSPEEFFLWLDAQGLTFSNRIGQAATTLTATGLTWKPGEAHHVAITWGDEGFALHVDGRLKQATRGPSLLALDETLVVGDPSNGLDAVVDELKVSKTVRRDFDGACAAVTPPPVSDLRAVACGRGNVRLTWTAPLPDASNGVTGRYLVKYYTESLNEQNWAEGEDVPCAFAPGTAETPEVMLVKGLPLKRLWFAVRIENERQFQSPLSNVAVAMVE